MMNDYQMDNCHENKYVSMQKRNTSLVMYD